MKIPKSFEDFTVRQFMAWNEVVNDNNLDRFDLSINLASAVTGKSRAELDKLSIDKRIVLKEKVDRLRIFHVIPTDTKIKTAILVKGRIYVPILNLAEIGSQLSQEQVELLTKYTEEGAIKNLNHLLALVHTRYRFFNSPIVDRIKAAKDFENVKVGDVLGVLRYYQKMLDAAMPFLLDGLSKSLTATVEAADQSLKELHASLINYELTLSKFN